MMKFKIARDKNGNKTLQIKPKIRRGFSIQTNGNLPQTHENGVNSQTLEEVKAYVEAWGTDKEKCLFI